MSDVMLKAEKLVEKKKWEKLKNKFLYGSDETRLALAAACGASDTDEACNILISLLHDENAQFQLTAVKSLGKIGDDHATAQLQWLLSQTSEDKKELIAAIHDAIKHVKNKQ